MVFAIRYLLRHATIHCIFTTNVFIIVTRYNSLYFYYECVYYEAGRRLRGAGGTVPVGVHKLRDQASGRLKFQASRSLKAGDDPCSQLKNHQQRWRIRP